MLLNSNIKHVIGIVSYIGKNSSNKRIKSVREALITLKNLKRDNNFIFIWDNNSTEDHKEFIKENCNSIDKIFFSNKNLYDFASLTCLLEISNKLNAEFITSLEDDMIVFDEKVIDACFKFLDSNKDCQHVRILKFDYNNRHIYDKILTHKDTDYSHAQRQFNQITKNKLSWENCGKHNEYQFYKNNYHWSSFPSVCRRSLFQKIIIKEDILPLQGIELKMMINFNELNFKTGVVDSSCIIHNQLNMSKYSSIRISEPTEKLISYQEVYEEVNSQLKNLFLY